MSVTARTAEAALSGLEDLDHLMKRPTDADEFDARLSRMNAEAGSILVEDWESLWRANAANLPDPDDL
jgi:hypothetical protein